MSGLQDIDGRYLWKSLWQSLFLLELILSGNQAGPLMHRRIANMDIQFSVGKSLFCEIKQLDCKTKGSLFFVSMNCVNRKAVAISP